MTKDFTLCVVLGEEVAKDGMEDKTAVGEKQSREMFGCKNKGLCKGLSFGTVDVCGICANEAWEDIEVGKAKIRRFCVPRRILEVCERDKSSGRGKSGGGRVGTAISGKNEGCWMFDVGREDGGRWKTRGR
jgi:hypothetical protein